jgi:dTDP-4-dehydrorhamnose 3,5-epimerase
MKVLNTSIADVLILEPEIIKDERGSFFETYQRRKFEEVGIYEPFVQDNHSQSRQGVLRGLHFQNPKPQGKLVRVVAGEIFDVAVDLRKSSETYSKWVGTNLSSASRRQVWVPPGFAHGFYVLNDWAEVVYKVTEYYNAEAEQTLRWDDQDVGVAWPMIGGKLPLLSPKDSSGRRLSELALFE